MDFSTHILTNRQLEYNSTNIIEQINEFEKPPTSEVEITPKILLSDPMYGCSICNFTAPQDDMLIEHFSSDSHMNAIFKQINFDSTPAFTFYDCPVCTKNFICEKFLIDHFQSDKHKRRKFVLNRLKEIDTTHNFSLGACALDENVSKMDYNFTIFHDKCIKPNKRSLRDILASLGSVYDYDETDLPCVKTQNQELATYKTCGVIKPTMTYIEMFLECGKDNIFPDEFNKRWRLELSIELTLINEDEILCMACDESFQYDLKLYNAHIDSVSHIDNLYILDDDDKGFAIFPDQYSDLELRKNMMKPVSLHHITCLICNIQVQNKDDKISHHMSNTEHKRLGFKHKEKSKDILKDMLHSVPDYWYYIQTMFCKVCHWAFPCEVSYVHHLKTSEHQSTVADAKQKRINLVYGACIPCSVAWFGYPCTNDMHLQYKMHKETVQIKRHKVPFMPTSAIDFLNNYSEQLSKLQMMNTYSIMKHNNMKVTLTSLEKTVQKDFEEAKAYFSGSVGADLSTSTKEVAVFLDCGDMYNGNSPEILNRNMKVMIVCLSNSVDWEMKKVMLNRTNPIIIAYHKTLDVVYHLTFANGLCASIMSLIKSFNVAYTPCRDMILFVTNWLELCDLNKETQMKRYTIIWLVIFYFQKLGVFPSVNELIKSKGRSNILMGCETGMPSSIVTEPLNMTFRQLLTGFFTYYSTFDYKRYVICPLLGKEIQKKTFVDLENRSQEMLIYERYVQVNSKKLHFSINSPMCIQDPIVLSRNITSATTKLALRTFKQYCTESAKVLKTEILPTDNCN